MVEAEDSVASLTLDLEIELAATGLLRLRAGLRNDGSDPFSVGALRLVLPVPSQAVELMDFAGRSVMERLPQRQPFRYGVHSRESRMGRPGHGSAYLLMAGTQDFGFRHGEVWGVHLGWSGNQNLYAERIHNGARVLGAAELLEQDEVRLAPGAGYRTPWTYASYGEGMDAVAGRFHRYLRARPQHPRTPRPVLVNTWEAVYFDHALTRLTAAGRPGGGGRAAERFVLDDGWFSGRRDDTRQPRRLVRRPGGLARGTGSAGRPRDASAACSSGSGWSRRWSTWTPTWPARTPNGCSAPAGRPAVASRHQHVLDLAHAGAYEHVLERLDALLATYDIAYLKWDHNRNLIDAGHTPSGDPGVHAHTLAVYRLLDELRDRHPGWRSSPVVRRRPRIDLGILERTDRVWASDCIDALERQQIQRCTGAAAAAGADRHPHRVAGGAHHRSAAQPDLPGGHRAVGAPRASSGT